ncbi:MAG: hypothetical protein SFW36_07045 [Leptolyngbyaceae cyanobacterium bins.59]|nr:hypothetical protein [Leptolyngbyaceae cyanobacterium bins.59]
MLRQNPPPSTPNPNGFAAQLGPSQNGATPGDTARTGSVDIQRELNRLEEIVLDSPRIPLSRRTLVDEEQLLDQLDLVRMSLPSAFQEAEAIVHHKEEIFLQAEHYAQEIIEAAERRAAQILDEMGIIRQAEQEARQIRGQVQQECEAIREQTLAEIEQMQRQAQQDLQEVRRRALVDAEEIQQGADAYADSVLKDMEQRLGEMMRIVRNGRQQLGPETAAPRRDANNGAGRGAVRR